MTTSQRRLFSALLVLFSIVPTIGAVLLTVEAKHQDAQVALDARLTETSKASSFELKSDMERFRQILLTSAQNPAFSQIILDPAHSDSWKRQVNLSLMQLTTIFPGMIDEACRITFTGTELGRVVQGTASPDANLSPNETGNPFFKPTVTLSPSNIHYQEPYISPDTHRWVVSVSTPIYVGGKNYGILHFEIPLVYYYRALKSTLPQDGFLALVSPGGKIYLTSGEGAPVDQPFPGLNTLSKDPGLTAATPSILGGKSGFAGWSVGNTLYRTHYETVEIAPGFSVAVLVGLPAIPGFVQEFGPYLLPILLLVMIALLAAYIVTTLFIKPAHNEKHSAHESSGQGKRTSRVWAALVIALTVALSVAYSISKLNASVTVSHQAEVSLVQLEGTTHWLDAIKDQTGPARASQSTDARAQADQTLSELSDVDKEAGGSISQRVGVAFHQYESDIEEFDKLNASGRTTEAHTWDAERISQSYQATLDVISDGKAVYSEAALRANALASVGSAIALGLAGLLMGLLFWRFELARRAAMQAEEAALRKSEKRFRSLVQNSSDVITIVGTDLAIHYQSASIAHVFGHDPVGLVDKQLTDLVHPNDAPLLMASIEDAIAGARGEERGVSNDGQEAHPTPHTAHPKTVNFRIQHSDGSWRYAETTLNNLLDDPDVCGLVLNTRDVSERKALEDELAHMAFHDSLTNLANRALFMDRLEHAMAHTARRTSSIAVLFLDLDGFKYVNDTLGHKVGDRLLVEVGQRLQVCLREADTVARIGGDEFTILLEDVLDLDDAVRVAERITEQLSAPFCIDEQQVTISSSIGIAVGDTVQDRPDALLINADAAMYEAKNTGNGRYAVFEAGARDQESGVRSQEPISNPRSLVPAKRTVSKNRRKPSPEAAPAIST